MITSLYTEYYGEILKYCCMLCGNRSEAEDLMQETFMKALSNCDLLQDLEDKQRRAWLYKTARNLFFDDCRKKAVAEKYGMTAAEEIFEGGFSQVETAMILSKLPPDLSQVFIRRYFLGYSSREIAQEYGLTPSGIRTMLSRARQMLKDQLKD